MVGCSTANELWLIVHIVNHGVLWLLLLTNQVNIPAHEQGIRTETHISDQGRGRQGSG